MLKSLEKLGLYIAKSTLSCCWRECASRIITSPRRVVLLFVGSDKSKIVADVLLLAHFARESIVWQMKIKFFYLSTYVSSSMSFVTKFVYYVVGLVK